MTTAMTPLNSNSQLFDPLSLSILSKPDKPLELDAEVRVPAIFENSHLCFIAHKDTNAFRRISKPTLQKYGIVKLWRLVKNFRKLAAKNMVLYI